MNQDLEERIKKFFDGLTTLIQELNNPENTKELKLFFDKLDSFVPNGKVKNLKVLFDELGDLAQNTDDEKIIKGLLGTEAVLHSINMRRVSIEGKERYPSISKRLVMNPAFTEADFSYLYDILQDCCEIAVTPYKDYAQSLVNVLYVAALERNYKRVMQKIAAKHPKVSNLKDVKAFESKKFE